MIGESDGLAPFLLTDTIVGNTVACMGFIRKSKYFIPNTALKQDVRAITVNRKRVVAVLRKNIDQLLYDEICYVYENTNLHHAAIQKIIDPSVLHSPDF